MQPTLCGDVLRIDLQKRRRVDRRGVSRNTTGAPPFPPRGSERPEYCVEGGDVKKVRSSDCLLVEGDDFAPDTRHPFLWEVE